jgi:hypothetical protein
VTEFGKNGMGVIGKSRINEQNRQCGRKIGCESPCCTAAPQVVSKFGRNLVIFKFRKGGQHWQSYNNVPGYALLYNNYSGGGRIRQNLGI